ncbi:MAG: cytochrome c family protein [Alphaproteobacteria bacterium]|nr:cytochrome c family protein [Alphaproteobacteria bacterium]
MRFPAIALFAAAMSVAPLMPAAAQDGDAEAGRRVFAQCRACHIVDNTPRNTVGPNLGGLWGRQAGAREGFRYSANMTALGAAGYVWNEANLRAYLTNPKAVAPQGSMAFAGISNPEQLTNLIAYLRANTQPQ